MKTALITGGTGGIGEGLVRAFTLDGWRVAFGFHQNREKAARLAETAGAIPFMADLRDEAQCLRLFSGALTQLGHIDCLIHCAGIDWQGLISDMPAGEWDSLMALNLRGAFILSREAVRHMRPLGGGSILLISSVQAAGGASCESAYAASKAGLIGLCRSLAREWGPCGIRVNCLSPGVIDAGMMDAFSPEDKEALRLETPLQRLGSPEDVAQAALFLSSEKAAFITGQVLGVDGGLVL